jgi:hypothetical protein
LYFALGAFGDAVDLFGHVVVAAILRMRLSLSCSCWRRTARLALADLEFPRGVVFLVGSYGEVPRGRVLNSEADVLVLVLL